MPKSEKGSVKDIAKRIKAKGLQKLKFYCQLCEKQCRDANGFKCHIQSESHLRQMKFFSENAHGVMDQYSREFEKTFLDTLRMLHGTVQVNANQVYQQVIRDRQHIHMNSTIWATLKDFCQYLGKTGKCRVEETERGWYITYIPRDVTQILRQQQHEQRIEAEKQAEMELQKQFEERRKVAAGNAPVPDTTNLQRRSEEDVIQISLTNQDQSTTSLSNKKKKKLNTKNVLEVESDHEEGDEGAAIERNLSSSGIPPPPAPPKTTAMSHQDLKANKRSREDNELNNTTKRSRQEEQQNMEKPGKRIDPSLWLYRDIVVRIIDPNYQNGKYFRRKAYVDRVLVQDEDEDNGKDPIPKPAAELTLIPDRKQDRDGSSEEGDSFVLRLPQDSLETVVPKKVESRSRVRILRGPYRGKKAEVLSLEKKHYQARLQLVSNHKKRGDGDEKSTILEQVPYEDFAEMA